MKLLLVGNSSVHVFHFYQLVQHFCTEVYFVNSAPGKKHPDFDIPHHDLSFSFRNPSKSLKTVGAIKKVIREWKPDVIHVHQANTIAALTLKAAEGSGVPTVVTAWGSDILLAHTQPKLYQRMLAKVLERGTVFTSDSYFMAHQMQVKQPKKALDIHIANFGIDPIAPQPKENIVYSNRLHNKLYRIDRIIQSFHCFSSQHPDWKLVVAGIGTETEALKQMVVDLKLEDKVNFVGWLSKEENHQWYAKSKLYVSVPESDATSMSLLEAMSAGCVPVVSNLPANLEWITPEFNGIVVTDINSDFISQGLKMDQQDVMAVNQKIIALHGTKEINSQKFIAVYKSLLA